MEVPFSLFPWCLLAFDGRRQEVVDRLYSERPCCLDDAMSWPLRSAFRREEWSMGATPVALQLLFRNLRQRVRLTNMLLERRLREHKHASPMTNKYPLAESFAYLGSSGARDQPRTCSRVAFGCANVSVGERVEGIGLGGLVGGWVGWAGGWTGGFGT